MLPDKKQYMEPLLDNLIESNQNKSINKSPLSNRTSLNDDENRLLDTRDYS